jgi:hypothetical protein
LSGDRQGEQGEQGDQGEQGEQGDQGGQGEQANGRPPFVIPANAGIHEGPDMAPHLG